MCDYRSHGKAVAWLTHRALGDDEFRTRLIEDTPSTLAELPDDLTLPEGITYRFLGNTDDTVNIVLPTSSGWAGYQRAEFAADFESRTSEGFPIFHDNFNIGPGRDPDFRDIIILNVAPPDKFLPPE